MPTFKIITFGDEVLVSKKLRSAAQSGVDTQAPMRLIVADMFRIEEQVFKSQGRRSGGSWAQLKPETIRRKGNSEILIETGDLFRSVTVPGARYQDVQVTRTIINFGTDRPGATTQQFGDASRGIRARPFLRFTARDVERWTLILREHLMAGYKRG